MFPSLSSTATAVIEEPTEDTKKSHKNGIKSFLSSKLFAIVVAFGVGVRVGVRSSVGASTTARQFPVASVLLAVVLIRQAYRSVPAWVTKKRKGKTATTDDPDDMSSLSAISFKLQSLFQVASEKLESSLPSANMRASLYTILQLYTQVKTQSGQAEERDKAYEECGEPVDPKSALEEYQQTFEFADWAYDEYPLEEEEETSLQERLATCEYELLRHDKTAEPGCVAHYVAISNKERKVLIGVKGSSSVEDLLTDCCGRAVNHTLPGPFVKDGPTEIFAHEGIYISSKRLAMDLEPFIKYVVIPNGYKILITGHSLGAGAAAMAGLLLRSKFPELQNDSKLQVVAFASPPILDRTSALACVSYTTTIVNNADVIPRASLHNLAIMMEFMKIVNAKLEEEGKLPDSFKDIAAFMRFVSEGKDGEMIMSANEIRVAMSECIEKLDASDPDFLYIPGRILHMYDLWSKGNYKEAEEEVEELADDDDDDSHVVQDETFVKTAERVYEADATSTVLKVIEVDERMVLDHLSDGYRTSIQSLLSSEYQ